MSSPVHKLRHDPEPARLSPAACPFCKGDGFIRYCERDPDTGRVAYEGTEPCEACDGAGWPGLLYGGPVREPARVYRIAPARLALGRVVATRGALDLARRNGLDVLALVRRHEAGDWGDVDPADALANDLALDLGARVLSAYETPAGRLWVITEADRSATTVLLPDEY